MDELFKINEDKQVLAWDNIKLFYARTGQFPETYKMLYNIYGIHKPSFTIEKEMRRIQSLSFPDFVEWLKTEMMAQDDKKFSDFFNILMKKYQSNREILTFENFQQIFTDFNIKFDKQKLFKVYTAIKKDNFVITKSLSTMLEQNIIKQINSIPPS